MGSLDVFRLRPFVTTAEEDDQCVAILSVVHAVAWPVVYPKLANPFTDVFPIAEETGFQPVQPRNDSRARGVVSESVQPFSQRRSAIGGLVLADFHRASLL